MSHLPPHDPARPRDVHVAMPRVGDRLSNALQGAYGHERMMPDDMQALLCELDRKTALRS